MSVSNIESHRRGVAYCEICYGIRRWTADTYYAQIEAQLKKKYTSLMSFLVASVLVYRLYRILPCRIIHLWILSTVRNPTCDTSFSRPMHNSPSTLAVQSSVSLPNVWRGNEVTRLLILSFPIVRLWTFIYIENQPLGVRYQLAGASSRHSPAVTPFQPLALIKSK